MVGEAQVVVLLSWWVLVGCLARRAWRLMKQAA